MCVLNFSLSISYVLELVLLRDPNIVHLFLGEASHIVELLHGVLIFDLSLLLRILGLDPLQFVLNRIRNALLLSVIRQSIASCLLGLGINELLLANKFGFLSSANFFVLLFLFDFLFVNQYASLQVSDFFESLFFCTTKHFLDQSLFQVRISFHIV